MDNPLNGSRVISFLPARSGDGIDWCTPGIISRPGSSILGGKRVELTITTDADHWGLGICELGVGSCTGQAQTDGDRCTEEAFHGGLPLTGWFSVNCQHVTYWGNRDSALGAITAQAGKCVASVPPDGTGRQPALQSK